MHTIELECPACDELLELDAGFAGGVCRCSSCGTLMTVPSDAAAGGHAEQLSRPDRPDDPSGMSGMGDVQATREDAPRDRPTRGGPGRRRPGKAGQRGARGKAGRSKGRGRGKARTKGKGRRSMGATETLETGVYTTASGKQVRIDRPIRVPMAQSKRKGIRIATGLVFFGVVLVVALIGGGAVWYMMANPKGGSTASGDEPYVNPDETQFVYNAAANPFTIEHPNVVGLPIEDTVAVVFEDTPANVEWRDTVATMVAAGLGKPGGEARVLVYVARPDGIASMGRNARSPNTVTAQSLSELFSQQVSGTGGVARAIKNAVENNATTVVLITGQPSADDVDAWRAELDSHPTVAVHAVMLNGYSTAYRDWIEGRDGGRFVSLSVSAVLDWQDEAGE